MPTAPLIPQEDQMSSAVNPQNFLVAAADLHQQGALSSPVPAGTPLQTGKVPKGSKRIKVVK
jgi:hypothetical protein